MAKPQSDADIHRAVSDDGTEIAGRVHGAGPPLVLVPGAMSDGETVWEELLPFLTDRFTCYTMSTRNRGLSGESTDLSPERILEDVIAFAESIGEPVVLLGWSGGGLFSLGAAPESDAISAVVAYEPAADEVVTEDVSARMMDTIERVSERAAAGDLSGAARLWVEFVATDDELAHAEELGLFEVLAPNVPVQLQEFEALFETDWDSPTDPSALASITVPVLLLCGTESVPDPWFTDSIHYIAEHVPDAEVCEIEGTGHLGPGHKPDAVADEGIRFIEETLDSPQS